MFVHTVIMVIEPHMKQGRQHKLISTIFLATSVTKKLDHNTVYQCEKTQRPCKVAALSLFSFWEKNQLLFMGRNFLN